MTITSIEIKKTENNARQLADVTIVFDYSLLITNIKLIDNGKKIFVEFSRSQRKESDNTFPDVVPLNPKIRNYIEREVIKKWRSEEVTQA